MVRCLEDLRVWRLSREFNQEIFKIISTPAFAKDFSLKDQLNRSAASITDNIAEGFGRNGKKEFIFFLACSKGSCVETKSQLYRALDRGYIDKMIFDKLFDKVDHIERMIVKLIISVKKNKYQGWRFV